MQLLTDDKSGASLCFARRFTNVSAERYKHLQSATAILILNRSIFTSQDEMQDEVMKC